MRKWLRLAALSLIPLLSLVPAGQPEAPAAPLQRELPAPVSRPAAEPRINLQEKMIALTFDDGPGPGTLRILNALEKAGGRGTFCMVGSRVEQYPDTVRRVARQGSEIATHSWSHPNLAKLSPARLHEELKKSMRAIHDAAGVRPRILRPPYGSISDEVRRAGREFDLAIANWNIDTRDWRLRDADAVYRHIVSSARDGAIVLCHDIYPETASAVERAIGELTSRGFQLVTVSELLEARAGGGRAGQVYYAA